MASYKWSHTILTRAKAKPVKLFKSDAEKNFQRDIDAARTGCSSLTARLAVAELEVSERREDAKRLAVEGADHGVLDKAEAKLRAAQDRVATLSSALAETKQTGSPQVHMLPRRPCHQAHRRSSHQSHERDRQDPYSVLHESFDLAE